MTPWILALWISCQAIDMGTTAAALSSGRFSEGNKLLTKRPTVIFSIKLGSNAGLMAMRKTRESKVVGVTMAAAGCFAGSWNAYQLRRRP